ncbi:hypothetical protein M2J83_09080 [Alcaligenes faecalis]|jgi:alkylhydroperoxidase/carboxymuconolactone decarboxylase family protein YurZ|uniref:Carboxymuconolactone decarboxylase-like domain-containing protein n=1 Tax=Alcaligenes faecalis TaxID=511 RepID=A0ABY7NC16_ALCFA|nr:hypothetical protein [Alcaligenes faecalis]WBM39947.1 hypothetical protein M2J83_09080 [Alcaligenes faecalis]
MSETSYKQLTQGISSNLAQMGASLEEVHEALSVAIYMGGGPSVMYAANAVAAFNEFKS